MKLSGKYTFNAAQPAVWQVLMDPHAIAKALPGVEALIPIEGDPNAWKATAKIGLAGINGTFAGIIRMSDIEAPNHYRLKVSGDGQQSTIGGEALIAIADGGNGKTLLTWEGDATISGKLAGIGQRLIGGAATMMANQFFGGLAKQIPHS
jgi:carbon monoxide dehydrogenase subunit G